MLFHADLSPEMVRTKIRRHEIGFGGNLSRKIYGTLHCKSGKQLKQNNRIFFRSEQEAQQQGFRPCGNCMKEAYQTWNNETIHKQP